MGAILTDNKTHRIMERYEFVEYDVINDVGEWVTVTYYELIEWDETDNEKQE